MKLKNYLLIIILLIVGIFSSNAQNKSTKSENTELSKDNAFKRPPVNVPFLARIPGAVGNRVRVRGDLVLIGNQILGATNDTGFGGTTGNSNTANPAIVPTYTPNTTTINNLPALTTKANLNNNGTNSNDNLNLEYIDVDTDETTFSSSTADLAIKNINQSTNNCKRVAYAGLYWSATYSVDRFSQIVDVVPVTTPPTSITYPAIPISADWNKIKFKVPGSSSYVELTADDVTDPAGEEDEIILSTPISQTLPGSPYVCYKNVTNLLKDLPNVNGKYTVANLRAARGKNLGISGAGWVLVVIYESVDQPSKFITVFDGYQQINTATGPIPNPEAYYDVSGFQTVPSPTPVRAKIGIAALDGDITRNLDNFYIKSPISTPQSSGTYVSITNSANPFDNTFNSSISTVTNASPAVVQQVSNRLPNGSNTMGFDLDLMEIPNGANATIANNATNATIKLATGNDQYGVFLSTFAVDIIAPEIVLNKLVTNNSGTPFGVGTQLNLGQPFTYEIGYQNVGNDDAINFTIKDILPANVDFVSAIYPVGVTYTYDPITRIIIFTIPNSLVLKNTIAVSKIKIRVKVSNNPLNFLNACSSTIKNQAFAYYKGLESALIVNEELSFSYYSSSLCYPVNPASSNFIVNVGSTPFIKNDVLCGSTLTLTAPTGYDSYSWTSTATGATVLTTASTYTVNAPGTYVVVCNIASPCNPATVNFVVTQFSTAITNPMLEKSDISPAPICASNNERMPIIKLCGADFRDITLNIANATSITWQKLTESSCPQNLFPNCALTNPACTWANVSTTSNYIIQDAGQYRINIVFQGGCDRTFYFTVYKNNLNPTIAAQDIGCNAGGQIRVSDVPANYEYQVETLNGVFAPWKSVSLSTPITVAGDYIIKIRIVNASATDCVITKNVTITDYSNIVMTVTPIAAGCAGDLGQIKVQINGAVGQYSFNLLNAGGNSNSTSGQISSNTFTFSNVAVGTYTVNGTAANGCNATQNVTINSPTPFSLDLYVTKPLTCVNGTIDFAPSGGTGTLYYYINGSTTPATNTDGIDVLVPSPNTGAPVTINYSIKVVDSNNCERTASISITSHPLPVFTITPTPIVCFGDNNGRIDFNVTANLGNYVLAYSINNGVTYQSSPNFLNLLGGVKQCILKYTLPGFDDICLTDMQPIIVVQPIVGLTASAGVSQLACNGLGNTIIPGTVRITNPQGGTPFSAPAEPYKYYFNGFPGTPSTNVPTNQATFPPGVNYPVYIQDSVGCVFLMNVTIAPPVIVPTIAAVTSAYNCDGTANSTVTVNNAGGNFTYEYILDPPNAVNTTVPTNVFTNVPCGPHTVRVKYKATNIPTYYNLLNETFGSGLNTTTPGIASAYCWNYQPAAPLLPVVCPRLPLEPNYASYTLEDNQYVVTKAINPNNGAWFPYRDHTSGGTDPIGRFLAVNIGKAAGANGILYSQTINNILPDQPVKVELYVANLLLPGIPGADPSFLLELVDSAGNVIGGPAGQVSTGIIDNNVTVPADPSFVANGWRFKQITLNPGNNQTLKFNIRSGNIQYDGNDAAIDDIRVFQEPLSCAGFIDYNMNVECGKKFDASITSFKNVKCKGDSNGTVTVAAQFFGAAGFDYQTVNSAGTSAWFNSLTSPKVIENLPIGLTTINLRYADGSTCTKTLTQIINEPSQLIATATAFQATCNVAARIEGGASGGTAAYEYQLERSPSGTIVTAYQASNVFNSGITTGQSYVVRVKDANGCIKVSAPVTINAVPTLTAEIDLLASDLCYDATNQATLCVKLPTTGLAPYSYAISPALTTWLSTKCFPVSAGTYILKVRDANLCEVTLPAITIAPQLAMNAVLVKDNNCSLTAPLAVVNGTIAEGTPPYTYVFNTGSGYGTTPIAMTPPTTGTTFTYSPATVANGTVKFKVTDAKGCTVESPTINFTIPTAINGSAAATATTCGLNNGTVTLTALTGTAPYKYSFNGSALTAGLTTYSLVAAQVNYPYKIEDDKLCIFNGVVTVTATSSLSGTASISTPYTCLGKGCITVTPSGGTAPYKYSLGSGFVTNNVFCDLTNGTYTPSIQDASGCVFILPVVTIAPLNPPIASSIAFSSTPMTCPSLKVDVTLSPNGTNPITTYEIIAPPYAVISQGTNNVFNLAAGTYTFKITDSKGCTFNYNYTVDPVNQITAVGQRVKDVQCFGTATGEVKFTIAGFTGTYNYQIGANPLVTNFSGTTISLINQPAGSYSITVKDNITNCTVTSIPVIIQGPTAPITYTKIVTDKTCLANGSATITPSGGWGNFTYALTPPGGVLTAYPTGVFTALSTVGTYNATITDLNGCPIVVAFEITDAVKPVLTLDTTVNLCYDGTNPVNVTVNPASGGLPPYKYFIDGTQNTTATPNIFPNVFPGSHIIKVIDANNCETVLAAPVVIDNQLSASSVLTKGLDCSASPNAVYTFTISGGTAPYKYQVNYNSTGFLPAVAMTIAGTTLAYTLANGAGTYILKFTDTKGCTFTTGTINLQALVPLTSINTVTNVICYGSATGSVTIVPSGGSGQGYKVKFGTSTIFSSNLIYSSLVAGTYNYVIQDSNLCISVVKTVTVLDLNTPIVAIVIPTDIQYPTGNCADTPTQNGIISITGLLGGVGPYQVTLSSPSSLDDIRTNVPGPNLDFTGLDFGIYTISIVDANNCTFVVDSAVKLPPNGLGIDTTVGQVSCLNGAEITIRLLPGFFPSGFLYKYALYIPSGLPLPQPQFQTIALAPPGTYTGLEDEEYTFTGLAPNTLYTFVVYSTTSNCYYFQQATTGVSALSDLVLSSVVVNNVTCIGNADASVNFTVSNYAATSVSYEIYTSLVQPTGITGIRTGLDGSPFTVSNFGPVPPGNYFVFFTINDGVNAGCTKGSTAFIVSQAATPLNFEPPVIKSDACGRNIGSILASTTGGAGGNLYQILTGSASLALIPNTPAYLTFLAGFTPTSTSASFGGLAAGTWVIYVKDANGCVKSDTVIVPTAPSPDIILPTQAANQCVLPVPAAGYTFTATTVAGTGTPPFNYTIIPNAGNGAINSTGIFTVPANLPNAVTYDVTVTDANECKSVKQITVYPPLNVNANVTAQVSCLANGKITASATGGTGTNVYTIDSVPPGAVLTGVVLTGNVFSNVPFGTYLIAVKNTVTNCTDTTSITLVEPAAVLIDTPVSVAVSCFGGNDGTVTVNLTGATNINTPYLYRLDGLPLAGQTTNLFTGVIAGPHTVTVTSALGCVGTKPVVVGQPTTALSVSWSATPFACAANNTVSTSTITLTGAGGTVGSGYVYSLVSANGPWLSNPFTAIDNNTIQTFTGYVKDAKGCVAQTPALPPFVINPLPKITLVTVDPTGTPINCTTNSQTVEVNVITGGSGNFRYSRLPASLTPIDTYQTANSFTLTGTGTFGFSVLDTTTGCTETANYTIAPFNTIDVVASAQAPASCSDDTKTITINVTGYSGAYTYKVFEGTNIVPVYSGAGNTTTNPFDLPTTYPIGSYKIEVTETAAPFCVKTSNVVTLAGPPAPLNLQLLTNVNANCSSPNALVTVFASGGTPGTSGYTYAAVTSILPVPGASAFGTLATLSCNPTTSATWYIYVKDANGCIIAAPLLVPVIKDAAPVVNPITPPVGGVCNLTTSTYNFTMSGSGIPPLYYSYNGSDYSLSTAGSVPIPSTGTTTIEVSVKDGNGCITTSASAANVTLYPALSLSSSVVSAPTCVNSDGEVSINVSGGSGAANYLVTISPLTSATIVAYPFITGLDFGVTYTITLKDSATGCLKTTTFTLATPQNVTLNSFNQKDVTCNAGANGYFTVILAPTTATVNNNQSYFYRIDAGPSIRPNQLSPFFDNLSAGTYTVIVTSGLNCESAPFDVVIRQPDAISVPLPTVVNARCATANLSSFAVITSGVPTGGNGPYRYEFLNGTTNLQGPGALTSYTVTNVAGGTNYFVKVYDVNGCEGISSPAVVVTPYIEITTVNVAVTSKITCLVGESIKVTATTIPVVPNPPLSYTVTGFAPVVFNQTNNTGDFNNLPIGSYNVSVRNTVTNCIVQGAVHYVNNPNTFELNVSNVIDVACNGGNTGSAQITIVDTVPLPTNDAGAFSYVIKDSSTVPVVVQSGNSPNAGPLTISNLSAGVYTAIATLTDLAGTRCTTQINFTITQPLLPLSITAVASGNVTCTNNKGAIVLTITGGTAPYTTTILNTTTNTIKTDLINLDAGLYTITVTDANGNSGGCFATANVTLTRPVTINGIAQQVPSAQILCYGDRTAKIEVINVTGGHVGPPNFYLYTLLNADGNPIRSPQSSNIFEGLPKGIYAVKITDDYNCDFTTAQVTINEPEILKPRLDNILNITCVDDAILKLSVSGGTPPYSYSSTINGTYVAFLPTTATFVNISAIPNTYRYYVKDNNGCISVVTNDIVVPARPVITFQSQVVENARCFGEPSGAITVTAQGGVNSNYTYTIVPAPAVEPASNITGEFNGLQAGFYTITATTSTGGCSKTLANIEVQQPLEFIVTLDAKNISCKGKADGQLSITTQNSVGEVVYSLTPYDPDNVPKPLRYTSTPTGLTSVPITGLKKGQYNILVQDLSGCGKYIIFNIDEPEALDNDPTEIISQEYCAGTNGGSFRVNIKGGNFPKYYVSLDNNTSTAVYTEINEPASKSHLFTGVSGGNHVVYVKDKNGCEIQIPVALDPAIVINASLKVDYICKDAVANPLNHINKLSVVLNPALLGTTTYQLDGAGAYQTEPFFYDVTPGPHYVNVKNEVSYINPPRTSLCVKPTSQILVKFIDPLVMN